MNALAERYVVARGMFVLLVGLAGFCAPLAAAPSHASRSTVVAIVAPR